MGALHIGINHALEICHSARSAGLLEELIGLIEGQTQDLSRAVDSNKGFVAGPSKERLMIDQGCNKIKDK